MSLFLLRIKGTDNLYARKNTGEREYGGDEFWLWRTTTDFERAQPYTSEARARAGAKAWQEDYAWRINRDRYRNQKNAPPSLNIEILEVEMTIKCVVKDAD